MSSYLRRHTYGVICFLLLVAIGHAITNQRAERALAQTFENIEASTHAALNELQHTNSNTNKIERPADFFVDQDRSAYQGHTIERRLRKALLEYPDANTSANQWVDVAYVSVKKAGKVAGTFDANIYFGLGNSADFGFFPFLGGTTKQLFISQDVSRGGCQWVVSLSPRFKVIFDGHELAVGREASDLGAIDLDNDGIYEIIAPITDFYAFQDKMSMSNIPLPDIIFKYHPTKGKYLPANSIFKNYLLEGLVEVPKPDKTLQNEFQHRAASLSALLTYIYVGEEKQGWDFYDKHYELDDKEEMRRRVKEILREQPVYNLIYNHGKRK